jgi:DMSO reductase anchor subunit
MTGERAMVPPAEPRTYYGRAVINHPVWTWEIPVYFFFGGVAGACGPLAAGARATGNKARARRAAALGLAAAGISPVLLISDLGRPERFVNMLRVFKPTSPMSVGTWILSVYGPSIGVAAGWQLLGRPGRRAGVPAQSLAAVTGPLVSTYTAALIANTAVPVWHDARRELPFLFASSSAAAAGGALSAITPRRDAGAARALGVAGAAAELGVMELMQRRLDPRVRRSYEQGAAHLPRRAARASTLAGAALLALRGERSRAAAALGGLALCAGSALTRWAVFKAGTTSADDPLQTVGPQRERLDEREPVKPSPGARMDVPADAPPAPAPAKGAPSPSASGPGMPEAQDEPMAPRRGRS